MEASNIVLVMVGIGAIAANGLLPRAAHSISGFFARQKPERRSVRARAAH